MNARNKTIAIAAAIATVTSLAAMILYIRSRAFALALQKNVVDLALGK